MAIVVLLSTPGNASYRMFRVSAGGVEQSALGGASININRPGDKWGIEVTVPPLQPNDDTRTFIASLNSAKRGSIIMNLPQLGLNIGSPGTPLVNGANQSGQSLIIDGCSANYPFKAGQFITIADHPKRHLHMIETAVNMNGSGAGTLPLVNPIRGVFSDNSVIEMNPARIHGFLGEGDGEWSVDRARHYNTRFTIIEQ